VHSIFFAFFFFGFFAVGRGHSIHRQHTSKGAKRFLRPTTVPGEPARPIDCVGGFFFFDDWQLPPCLSAFTAAWEITRKDSNKNDGTVLLWKPIRMKKYQ
jgi:hypothetical protein